MDPDLWMDFLTCAWTCLVSVGLPKATGKCLTKSTITGPDPHLEIDILAQPHTCLITTNLTDDLGSWLDLATITASTFLGTWP